MRGYHKSYVPHENFNIAPYESQQDTIYLFTLFKTPSLFNLSEYSFLKQ